MLRAIEQIGITNDNQPRKKDLEAWFLAQKIKGQPVSGRDAERMASFVRLPESRAGRARKKP
jgi:hypothetical protein